MARYVDGFLLPMPKKNVGAYRRNTHARRAWAARSAGARLKARGSRRAYLDVTFEPPLRGVLPRQQGKHTLDGILRVSTSTKGGGVLEFQKLLHLVQCLVQRQMKGAAAWPRAGEAQLVLQPAIDHLQIGPAQYLLAP